MGAEEVIWGQEPSRTPQRKALAQPENSRRPVSIWELSGANPVFVIANQLTPAQ